MNTRYECDHLTGYRNALAAWDGEPIWFMPAGGIVLGDKPYPHSQEITIKELRVLAAQPKEEGDDVDLTPATNCGCSGDE